MPPVKKVPQYDSIADLCSGLTSERVLPGQILDESSESSDQWLLSSYLSSSDQKFEDFSEGIRRNQKKEIRVKLVNEFRKDLTFEKIRHKYTQMHSKPLTYDPVIYGQFAMGSGSVQNRLIDIYGDDVLHLQDPEYSQKCLNLYKQWKIKQEEIREGQRLLKAYEVDKRGELSLLKEKEKTRLEKQLARFKHLKTTTTQITSDASFADDSFYSKKLEEKQRNFARSRSRSTYKYGRLTLETDQILIRHLKEKDVEELYETADKLLDPEKTLFPKEYFKLRRRKESRSNVGKPAAKDEEKSSSFSSSVKEKLLKTFTSDRSDSKRISFTQICNFSDDNSHSFFVD